MENESLYSPTRDLLPIRELSSPKKGWVCGVCGFQSLFRTSLINHQAVHSDARPFECPTCDYAAKRKYDLKKHIQLKHWRDDASSSGGIDVVAHEGIYGSIVSSSERWNSFPMSSQQTQPDSMSHKTDDLNRTEKDTIGNIGQVKASCKNNHQNLSNVPNVKLEPPDEEDDDDPMTVTETRFQNKDGETFWRESFGISDYKLSKNKPLPQTKYHSSFPSSSAETPDCISKSNSQQKRKNIPYLQETRDAHEDENHYYRKRFCRTSSSVDNPTSSMSVHSEMANQSEVSCSSVKIDKQCETKKTFSCPHCDILYFDHALFLMHMGLHGRNRPWQCAVCGQEFLEKYSFTSHFINQHSHVTFGD